MNGELHYRNALEADVPALMEIRASVRENVLVSTVLHPEYYRQSMFVDGRGWVCELDGVPVGFVCARIERRDIWAIFVRPEAEGRGIGSVLMDFAESWLFSTGIDEIELFTDPGTRAEAFYRRRGWVDGGFGKKGEVRLLLRSPRGA